MTDEHPPILVLAPTRSGSTRLARLPDANPDIAAMPETAIFNTVDHLGLRARFLTRTQYLVFLDSVWRAVHVVNPVLTRMVAELAVRGKQAAGPMTR